MTTCPLHKCQWTANRTDDDGGDKSGDETKCIDADRIESDRDRVGSPAFSTQADIYLSIQFITLRSAIFSVLQAFVIRFGDKRDRKSE